MENMKFILEGMCMKGDREIEWYEGQQWLVYWESCVLEVVAVLVYAKV